MTLKLPKENDLIVDWNWLLTIKIISYCSCLSMVSMICLNKPKSYLRGSFTFKANVHSVHWTSNCINTECIFVSWILGSSQTRVQLSCEWESCLQKSSLNLEWHTVESFWQHPSIDTSSDLVEIGNYVEQVSHDLGWGWGCIWNWKLVCMCQHLCVYKPAISHSCMSPASKSTLLDRCCFLFVLKAETVTVRQTCYVPAAPMTKWTD